MNKMTKQEKLDWDELYEYVKKEILQYDDTIKLSRSFILRLHGLRDGKFMANKTITSLGSYPFNIILMTFKLNKFEILKAISNRNKFKDENHMINYLMVIVENKINDTCSRINKVEKAKEQGEKIEINLNDEKAEYKTKTKTVTNSRLKDLL